MPTHSILQAKIREITEAFQEAQLNANVELAHYYNRELLVYLLRLASVIGNPTPDRGTDSGEL